MKKLLAALIVFVPLTGWADTVTGRLSLTEPDVNSANWGTKLNNNFGLIDAGVGVLGKTNTWTGTNNFTGPIVISSYTTIVSSLAISTLSVTNLTATNETVTTLTVTSSATLLGGSLTNGTLVAVSTLTASSATLTGVAGSTITFSSATFTNANVSTATVQSLTVSTLTVTSSATIQLATVNSTFTARGSIAGAGLTAGTSGQMLVTAGGGLPPFYAGGRILQIVRYTVATATNTTTTTWINSPVQPQITPLSTGSTIYIFSSIQGDVHNAAAGTATMHMRFSRGGYGGTVLNTYGDAFGGGSATSVANDTWQTHPGIDWDSPGSLSIQTYVLQFNCQTTGAAGTCYINEGSFQNPVQVVLLVEVGP